MIKRILPTLLFCLFVSGLVAQISFKGTLKDETTGEELIGANVIIKGTTTGTVTDWDGSFAFQASNATYPVTLVLSYIGYEDKEVIVQNADQDLNLKLGEGAITTTEVVVKGQRVSDKQKAAPLTVESMDLLAIKETPAENFYDGLGSLKGVDLTAASLGFKVINTRGFNSTSPVRSLQTIDGVDNQAPGLNFSLGNFLGSSELDVLKVDLIQGAASAYYGPNAFNGVIAMETKNPFFQRGLAASIKAGERNLVSGAIRYADHLLNEEGKPWMAFKLNFFALRADDWVADNNQAVDGTDSPEGNPGGWDRVNTYGDEYFSLQDYSDEANLTARTAALGVFHRQGYDEVDLVDYDTENMKGNVSLHFRTNPSKEYESPEVILSSSVGSGTTVYQGDNRFSLRNLRFFQNRIEFRKKDKFFIRAYSTHENAGDSYDPYFTALRLQETAKSNVDWANDYVRYWTQNVNGPLIEAGYPEAFFDPNLGMLVFDREAALRFPQENQTLLNGFHEEARNVANRPNNTLSTSRDFFVPGTDRFQQVFDSITSLKNTEGGTRFFDESALYHVAGEYKFTTDFFDEIAVGASGRLYAPQSQGTVFKDTADVVITNKEVGGYIGLQKKIGREYIISTTFRVDKNENFNVLVTPALSFVWSPDPVNYFRFSFSGGIRNPTLSDQYLNLDVGRATLLGNLDGFNDLITVESFEDYLGSLSRVDLDSFNVAPVKPEKVKTFEVGYRTTLFEALYVDASYYYSIYDDFLGFNIGIQTDFTIFNTPINTEAYRIAANSANTVTTQGFAIGLNYYFAKYYSLNGNYSWNKLNESNIDDPNTPEIEEDPIIPAFNTPEHKFNLGISGRNLPLDLGFVRLENTGFSLNYKWIQGFLFEGSPQFTGFIDNYSLLDVQWNVTFKKINTTIKIGASNVLDNRAAQTYGGPEIGRLGYISATYDFVKK